jgi:holo-[acyl-carrier protein] synthase
MAAANACTIGIDLVSIPRMEGIVARWGGRFLERVFTAGEIEYCRRLGRPAGSLAARFAAKEAFVKAISRRAPVGLRYRDVEVVIGEGGVPSLAVHGSAMEALGRGRAEVSLSHEEDFAVAVVMICPEVES